MVGVDVDIDAVEIAQKEASKRGLEEVIKFIYADIRDFHQEADTVIQNPPFGAQKAHRKEADRIFMSKSLEIAPVVYSFHLRETEDFVREFFQSEGVLSPIPFIITFPYLKSMIFIKKNSLK